MPSNATRKEAYHFYRSLGYSSKEASNLRNKSPKTLSNLYRSEVRQQRRATDDWDGETPPAKTEKPYRPDLDVDNPDYYRDEYETIGLPSRFFDQIFDNPDIDLIDLEVYSDRFEGLKSYFDGQADKSDFGGWDDILEMLGDIDDLGDFLDALGELYDDE